MDNPAAPVDPNAAAVPPVVAAPVVASVETSPAPVAAPPAAAPAPAEAAAVSAPVAAPPAAAAAAPAADAAPKSGEPVRDKTLLEKFDDEQKAAQAAKAKEADKAAAPKPADKAADKAAEAKPGDKAADAKVADAAAADAKLAEPAKPEAVAYEYKLPDTIKMDDTLKGEFHTALDAFRADPAKGVQPLIDLHNKTMQMFAEQTLRNQFDVFNKTTAEWDTKWQADAEIGGSGYETALRAIARTRDLGVSSAKPGSKQYQADMAEFTQFLNVTGAGSHPAFGRLLHNLARYVDEPQAHDAPLSDIKPPKGNGRGPGSKLYDHPTSQRMTRS